MLKVDNILGQGLPILFEGNPEAAKVYATRRGATKPGSDTYYSQLRGDSRRILLSMRKPFVTALVFVLFHSVFIPRALSQILPFRAYTTRDGLPSNTITSLYQDSRGFLWVATDEGLSVFDGVTFRNLAPAHGIPWGRVSNVVESKQQPGVFWIATHGGGVAKLFQETLTHISLQSSPHADIVDRIVEDAHGVLWCATHAGIYRIEGERISPFQVRGVDLPAAVIAEIADTLLYIGVKHRLWSHSIAADRTSNALVLPLGGDEWIESITASPDGIVWVGTSHGALFEIRDGAIKGRRSLGSESIMTIFEDGVGNLFVGTYRDGLIQLSGEQALQGEMIRYTTQNGLSENIIRHGMVDSEGNLWIGTNSRGLIKLSERNIYSFPLEGGVRGPVGTADRNNHIWIPTGSGLWEIWRDDVGIWRQSVHHLLDRSGSGVSGFIHCDARGRLWTLFANGTIAGYTVTPRGTESSRLVLETTIPIRRIFPESVVQAFRVDQHNRLWVSLELVGVAVIDVASGSLLKTYSGKDELLGSSIRAFYEDHGGNLWFGDFEAGLTYLEFDQRGNERFHHFTSANGLPDNAVRAIFQSRDGRIWIGTRSAGLVVYDGQAFERIRGLHSSAVWGIAEDRDGKIWVSTSVGIHVLEPRNPPQVQFVEELLDLRGGMCGTTANDLVWVATTSGLTVYDLRKTRLSPSPPPVYITRFLVSGSEMLNRSERQFAHDQNNITVEYVGPTFRSPGFLRYQHRIREVDTAWHDPTGERAVTFALLRPGTYTFEVRAVDLHGNVSEEPAMLAFSISPPIWQRWWFVSIVLAVILLSAIGVHRSRVRRLLEIERVRTRIASDLHDDLATNLSSIAMFSKIVLDESRSEIKGEHTSQLLERMTTLAKESVDSIRDIIWTIDPKTETLYDFLTRVRDMTITSCKARAIRPEVDFPVQDQLPSRNLIPEERKHLWLLLKEAVNNVIKHSGCTELSLEARYDEPVLVIRIRDNGRGFDPSSPVGGKGLGTMKMRAEQLGGNLSVSSHPGKGTEIQLTLRL